MGLIAKKAAKITAITEIDVTSEHHWKFTLDHKKVKGKSLDNILAKILAWGVTFSFVRLDNKQEILNIE